MYIYMRSLWTYRKYLFYTPCNVQNIHKDTWIRYKHQRTYLLIQNKLTGMSEYENYASGNVIGTNDRNVFYKHEINICFIITS